MNNCTVFPYYKANILHLFAGPHKAFSFAYSQIEFRL
jgi:hypothetical protein